jgi:hypothetical protein
VIVAFVNAGTSLISETQAPIDRPGHEHEQAVAELDDTIREATLFTMTAIEGTKREREREELNIQVRTFNDRKFKLSLKCSLTD